MKILTTVFLFIFPILSAQLKENFETSSLTGWKQKPPGCWEPDPVNAISGIYSFHHNYDDSISGISQAGLIHDILLFDSAITTWKFKVRHGYSPSSGNNWCVFIASGKNKGFIDPGGGSEAYLAGVNFTGNDDTLKVWKLKNNSVQCLLQTNINWQEMIGTNNYAGIEIIRKVDGLWEMWIESMNSGNHSIYLGSFIDTTILTSACFGIYYKYTANQDKLLWFDDLVIEGSFNRDTIPPLLQKYWTSGTNSLILEFNEEVGDSVKLTDMVSDLNDNSISAWHVNGNRITVFYTFHFQPDIHYILSMDYISDVFENCTRGESVTFLFHKPAYNDVIITEIMADPTPANNLPEEEYIEIFNRSDFTISLDGWHFYADKNKGDICCVQILPKEYLLLCDKEYSDLYKPTANKIQGVEFPLLSNKGQILKLTDGADNIINSVYYSDEWYRSEEKKYGGWSLEMIDINNPCAGKENWIASESISGGSPGIQNSKSEIIPDLINPSVKQVVICRDTCIYLAYNEKLIPEYINDRFTYTVNNGIGNPISVKPDILFTSSELIFKNLFKENVTYTLTFNQNLSDCAGNFITGKQYLFKKPEPCIANDIIINEILFNSFEKGGDFVELVNISFKVINIEGFTFYEKDIITGGVENSYLISESPYALNPGEFIVLTRNIDLVLKHYKADETRLFEMRNFPDLSNAEANIGITDSVGNVIDEVFYSDEMTFELITNSKGISTERIHNKLSSTGTGGWYAASADAGFATPGYENSQSKKDAVNNSVSVDPVVFSPDFDEYNDYTTISYSFEEPGYVSTILIFNKSGVLVKTIAKNSLLGTAGSFMWDGITDKNSIASVGIYLIYFEAFNSKGNVIKIKKTCIIAEKLN